MHGEGEIVVRETGTLSVEEPWCGAVGELGDGFCVEELGLVSFELEIGISAIWERRG